MTGCRRTRASVLASLAVVVGLGGCATAQRPDPIEPWNRGVFAFNEAVDIAVLKPAATAWQTVLPGPVRTGVGNFFDNLHDVWSATNLALQGRFGDGASELVRFGTNTVFGVLGLFDVATELGLERHGEDLGQTLGHWGVGPGAYIVWPVFGPSTLRDTADIPFDIMISPAHLVSADGVSYALTGARLVNTRADLLKTTQLIDEIALDKYTFVRDAYLQRRRSLVYNGNPPDEPDEPDEAVSAEPASPAASAPPKGR
jgi:phospholipid-binding lipoprotein MlaA